MQEKEKNTCAHSELFLNALLASSYNTSSSTNSKKKCLIFAFQKILNSHIICLFSLYWYLTLKIIMVALITTALTPLVIMMGYGSDTESYGLVYGDNLQLAR